MKRSSRKNLFYAVASVVLSTIVHFIFLALFMQLDISPAIFTVPERKPSHRIKPLEMLPLLPRPERNAPAPEIGKKFEIKKVELQPNVPDSVAKHLPDIPSTEPAIESKTQLPRIEDLPETTAQPALPKILTVDGDSLPEERKLHDRTLIPKLPRSDDVAGFPASPALAASRSAQQPPALPPDMRITLPPKKTPDDTELPVTPDTRMLPGEPVQQMDLMIDVRLSKLSLPDGSGFFRIDMLPNEKAEAMPPFRKDVVFLLDASGSMGKSRLDQMKEAIRRSLKNLHLKDRFNIVAFRADNIPLFPEEQHPNDKAITEAENFLFKLRHVGSTNIYSALQAYAGQAHRTAARPLLVFLLSDGNVNYGEIVGNSELINSISNKNHNGSAIYTFASGDDKNSFLMDLIAYRNRGDSRSIRSIDHSSNILARFINNVSDIRVADLDYQISENLADHCFPKRLPNLHKGISLSVFGRYPRGTHNVGLRITGTDSTGVRRELVFGGSLQEAPDAPPDLPQIWAQQYIFHLYSLLTVNYDENIRNAIHQTAEDFKLELPYLDKHLLPRKKPSMQQ
ncbi:MAG: VWA domain-containing protein [Victivallales bacterium]|nr:VWA domain-containing protein [Victivallales bacterium]